MQAPGAGVRWVLAAAAAAGLLGLLPGAASANTIDATYYQWNTAGYSQTVCTSNQTNDLWGASEVTGSPGPTFGVGTMTESCNGKNEQKAFEQYVSNMEGGSAAIPADATLLGAELSGAVSDSAVAGYPLLSGPQTFNVCTSMTYQPNSVYQCGGAIPVSVTMPGNTAQAVGFEQDVSGFIEDNLGAPPGELWLQGPGFLAPSGTFSIELEYATTPSDIAVGPIQSGAGTQAEISWNPGGDDSTTTYVLQREVLQDGTPAGGWSTIYQGAGDSFDTTDQVCGAAYVYRVAAAGPDGSTPWDESAEWDEFPCTVAVTGVSENSISISWPQVSPATVPDIVWCAEDDPSGGISCEQTSLEAPAGYASATIAGLDPNTEYAVWACSATNTWGCPEVNAWTDAATPTLSVANGVAPVPYNAQPLSWAAGANPAGTAYQLWQATLGPTGGADGESLVYQGTATSDIAAQAPGNSYAYTVSAVEAGYGESTASSNAVAVQVAPVPLLSPSSPTAATLSWTSIYGMTAVGVECEASGSGAWTDEGQAPAASGSMSIGGLTPNTAYTCGIDALATNQGVQWWEDSAEAYTAPATPTAGTLSATQAAVTVTWGSGGNPSGTLYRYSLVPAGASPSAASSASTALTSITLSADSAGQAVTCGTAYAAAVEGVGGSGQVTAWVEDGQITTVPCSPTRLSGADYGLGWSASGGRGGVSLSWAPVAGASGYAVWVWDGAQYEGFDVGDATEWSSAAALIYPPDSALYPNVSEGGKSPPLFSQNAGGLDLRDLPQDLYCTTGAAYCDGTTQNYWFTVSAYNAAGNSASYEVPGTSAPLDDYYEPTLPLQSDPNPPEVTDISAGNAQGYVYGPDVTVSVQADESPSGIAGYAISNDGTTWSTTAVQGCQVGQVAACASALDVQQPWTLTPGPGTKTVYVRVESTAGVWSADATTTVYVEPNQSPPAVYLVLDGGDQETSATAVTAATELTDPLATEAGLTFQARYSVDGGQTWTPWQAMGSATSWTAEVTLPGGAGGERTVLEQVEDSDSNLGQSGATIDYVNPAAANAAPASAAPVACQWPVGGVMVSATCVTETPVSVPLAPPSGEIEMRASLDGASWGQWMPAADALPITLVSSPGLQTVWVEYRDAGGDVTASTRDDPGYFVYDPGAPTLTASWLGDASATDPDGNASLQLQAGDPAGGSSELTVTVTENGATLYSGAYQPAIPVTLNGEGYQYVQVTVTDVAGNQTSEQLGIFVE